MLFLFVGFFTGIEAFVVVGITDLTTGIISDDKIAASCIASMCRVNAIACAGIGILVGVGCFGWRWRCQWVDGNDNAIVGHGLLPQFSLG